MSRTVAVSGASGLIGRALCAALEARGDRVVRLVRHDTRRAGEVRWDPSAGVFDADGLRGIDAVVHLAGSSIAVRWSEAAKRRIRDSRVEGTRLLATGLRALDAPPRAVVSASAIGWYGDGRGRTLDERAPAGDGWLAEVCRAWEAAAAPLADAGVRVAYPRTGIVLSPDGGALAKMRTPFRLGLGGRVGDGRQGMSWVGLHDAVRALLFAVDDDRVRGAFNVTAPNPVTNAEFTRTLGRVLRRPTVLPVPAAAVSLLFGEMGRRLLLDGDRVLPSRLDELGFTFAYPELEPCLRHELGRL